MSQFYLVRSPWLLQKLYPSCIWRLAPDEKIIYLTFDDGPHPTITPFVLEQLRKYDAKATFFCIGENVKKHPATYQSILEAGHAVGNHTMNHLNGWQTDDAFYLDNIRQANAFIQSHLFRPPYGRIKRNQLRMLFKEKLIENGKNVEPKIIMWTVLAGDWIVNLRPETCYRNLRKKIKNGDIIVLHDSEKAWERMVYVLPLLLKEWSEKGYRFEAIGKNGS